MTVTHTHIHTYTHTHSQGNNPPLDKNLLVGPGIETKTSFSVDKDVTTEPSGRKISSPKGNIHASWSYRQRLYPMKYAIG